MLNARKVLILSLTVLLIGVLFYIYTIRGSLESELVALKLVPEEEALTELYLNNSTALPTEIDASTTVPFSFTIHNLEGTSETYVYNVSMVLGNGARVMIASSSVTLADEATTTVSESILFEDGVSASAPATVYITLPAFNESLHFVLPSREQE